MKDYLEMRAMESRGGFTPYEQVKLQNMQAKRPSGLAIGGLVTAVGAAVGVVGFGMYAVAKAKEAKTVAAAENAGTAALLRQVTEQVVRDHNESITRDFNITNTITDTQSGSQQGQLSQSQQLSNEIALGVMTGEYERRPQRVALYQDAKPCACPSSGCGCMG